MRPMAWWAAGGALALAAVVRGGNADGAGSPRRFGGPCEYASHPGVAEITGVDSTERSRGQRESAGGPGYEGYEVRFRFVADGPVPGELGRKALEREHLFQLANSWYPGERYLEKYGIAPGKRLRGELRVITKGTCTPVLFSFDDAKRDDYFESQP